MASAAPPEPSSVSPSVSKAWARARAGLRSEFGDEAFRSWIGPLTLEAVRGSTAILSIKSRFLRDWVSSNYRERIIGHFNAESPAIESVDLVAKVAAPETGAPAAGDSRSPARPGAAAPDDEADRTPSLPLEPRYTFDSFVVGKPNELAYAAAQRVADSEDIPFNPLFIHGGVGLGKTHLMHAMAWRIRERTPWRRVAYISAEKFMYQFIRALRFKDMLAFKEQFRSVDVLMIDDVQFMADKGATQEEFFHTFNALMDERRQVVVSADKSPSDLSGIEERLISRFNWGLVADVHPTTYELRLSILQAKAARMPCEFPDKVLEFIAHKIQSNVRELEGALNRMAAHASLVGRTLTIEMAADTLKDVLRANERHITIEEIQRNVCAHFNIKMTDMSSARRARAVARPRQIAMYLAKMLTSRSLPEIGRKFGNRDHTTVMHAVRKIEELRAIDPSINEDVEILIRALRG
ncbi:MAG: chromosomal replication initiator protein DnaA [Rhodospirillaceae bacterium]|nr:chromosomal replication initiator protein DnaA [Rhodospirillaceae bacterium]